VGDLHFERDKISDNHEFAREEKSCHQVAFSSVVAWWMAPIKPKMAAT
jgi:hypothetical protein